MKAHPIRRQRKLHHRIMETLTRAPLTTTALRATIATRATPTSQAMPAVVNMTGTNRAIISRVLMAMVTNGEATVRLINHTSFEIVFILIFRL
jgi:hypothetical protein